MKHHIIITVANGLVQSVHSTDSDDEVTINDLDTMPLEDCKPISPVMSQIY